MRHLTLRGRGMILLVRPMAGRRLSSQTLLKFVRIARRRDALPELKELLDTIRADPGAKLGAFHRQQSAAFKALSGFIDSVEANVLKSELDRARERAWAAIAVWTNEEGGG